MRQRLGCLSCSIKLSEEQQSLLHVVVVLLLASCLLEKMVRFMLEQQLLN